MVNSELVQPWSDWPDSPTALEQDHLNFAFFHFSNFGLWILQSIQTNPCRFMFDNKKGPPNECAKFH